MFTIAAFSISCIFNFFVYLFCIIVVLYEKILDYWIWNAWLISIKFPIIILFQCNWKYYIMPQGSGIHIFKLASLGLWVCLIIVKVVTTEQGDFFFKLCKKKLIYFCVKFLLSSLNKASRAGENARYLPGLYEWVDLWTVALDRSQTEILNWLLIWALTFPYSLLIQLESEYALSLVLMCSNYWYQLIMFC